MSKRRQASFDPSGYSNYELSTLFEEYLAIAEEDPESVDSYLDTIYDEMQRRQMTAKRNNRKAHMNNRKAHMNNRRSRTSNTLRRAMATGHWFDDSDDEYERYTLETPPNQRNYRVQRRRDGWGSETSDNVKPYDIYTDFRGVEKKMPHKEYGHDPSIMTLPGFENYGPFGNILEETEYFIENPGPVGTPPNPALQKALKWNEQQFGPPGNGFRSRSSVKRTTKQPHRANTYNGWYRDQMRKNPDGYFDERFYNNKGEAIEDQRFLDRMFASGIDPDDEDATEEFLSNPTPEEKARIDAYLVGRTVADFGTMYDLSSDPSEKNSSRQPRRQYTSSRKATMNPSITTRKRANTRRRANENIPKMVKELQQVFSPEELEGIFQAGVIDDHEVDPYLKDIFDGFDWENDQPALLRELERTFEPGWRNKWSSRRANTKHVSNDDYLSSLSGLDNDDLLTELVSAANSGSPSAAEAVREVILKKMSSRKAAMNNRETLARKRAIANRKRELQMGRAIEAITKAASALVTATDKLAGDPEGTVVQDGNESETVRTEHDEDGGFKVTDNQPVNEAEGKTEESDKGATIDTVAVSSRRPIKMASSPATTDLNLF